ncbi:MAG: septal ring lytic transglycosylase RlpA family protein [Syntrophobacterales bacterium]|nr:septal ring lytic transglycosylase RlpA family protein [Syntrophobacterales bacterium]
MIALIPGLERTGAYFRPAGPAAPGEDFSRFLASLAPTPAAAPTPATYQVQPGDTLTSIARKLGYGSPLVLARANGLTNPDFLRPGQVLTLPPPQTSPPPAPSASRPALVVATWYGPRHHGRPMANGRPFDMEADTAAHRSLPLGTRLKVTNPQNGRSVEVTVTDRGPFIPGRHLDLSLGAARKLGIIRQGVARLYVEPTSG